MGSGDEITTSNKSASFAMGNRKMKLISSGTLIQSATKQGMGQDAYCESTSAGLTKFTNYELVDTALWQMKQASILWPCKWGHFQPSGSAIGDCRSGFIQGSTATGSFAIIATDTTEGKPATFTSGASAGNQAGLKVDSLYTCRKFNPSFKLRWAVDEAAANFRFFAGFYDSTSLIGNSDDPLNAANGFAIGVSTAQANYRIFHNDGSGATASDDTGIAKSTAFHTIELWADDNNTKWWWSLDGSTPAAVTSDIPAQTTILASQFTVTAVNADAKVLTVVNCLVNSEK